MQSLVVSKVKDSGQTSIQTATSQKHDELFLRLDGAREPYVLATENDTLNGVGMLFGKLLTNTAQIFADV